MTKKMYTIATQDMQYNDEYYEFEGGYSVQDLYSDKKEAEKEAEKQNLKLSADYSFYDLDNQSSEINVEELEAMFPDFDPRNSLSSNKPERLKFLLNLLDLQLCKVVELQVKD